MDYPCTDCGASVEMPNDALPGEIIGCPDCGLDYVIETDEGESGENEDFFSDLSTETDEGGEKKLIELTLEGEDWGE